MRIAFISTMSGHSWGGSEILWSQAAVRLSQAGHQVVASVCWWPETPAPIAALRRDGIEIRERRVGPQRPVFQRVAGMLRRKFLGGVNPFERWIQRINPDLVCVSNGGYCNDLQALEACASSGRPFFNIAQANSEQFWPSDEFAASLLQVLPRARRCFFVSHGNRNLMEDQLGVALPNAEVVMNPFNVDWWAAPNWPASTETYRVACVARLEPAAKGQDLLFHVLAMEKWRSRPVEVTLYGKGPCEAGLMRLTESLMLGSKVHFAGHVPDVANIWGQNHALILPSRYEGLPLALIEAMLCARPAIVTDVAGNAEPIEDNVTGFIAAAPTVAHLDEALERAWQRRQEWQAIGRAAATHIRQVVPSDPVQAFINRLLELAAFKA